MRSVLSVSAVSRMIGTCERFLQALADAQAVLARHHDVQHDRGPDLRVASSRSISLLSDATLARKPRRAQVLGERRPDIPVVVDDEYVSLVVCHRCCVPYRPVL